MSIVVRQNCDTYEIKASYDPAFIDLVKQVPGRRWENDKKLWIIDKDRLGMFMNQVKGTIYEGSIQIISEEMININADIGSVNNIPNIDVSSVPFSIKPGAKPYDHQIDFMKYAIHKWRTGHPSGFFLGDDPGLGKTAEVMNIALYHKNKSYFKHCLIVCCIATSKYNWYEDILEHTNGSETPYILGTRFRRDKVTHRYDTGNPERLKDLETGHMYGKLDAPELPYFLIVNIEAFRMKEGKRFPFTEAIIKMIKSGEINMIAIDEIHKNMSCSSMQGKQILKVKRETGSAVHWIPMTGTPIVGKPTDLFLPLRLIDAHNFSDFYNWCQYFCLYGGFGDHEIVGYRNIPQLKRMLQNNMLRRLKKDVLDLPPKIYYTEYVENTPYQKKLYQKVVEGIIQQKGHILQSLNPMTKFLRLRQVNGSPEIVDDALQIDDKYLSKNAKMARIIELLDDNVAHGEKTLVFSNWVEPLRTLYRFVSKRYKTCCYTGTMSEEDREKHKRVFMTNPEYKVMIGTIGAMGTSHTLTAANHIIFLDEPWVPTDKEQAEDRAYRIGTDSTVSIRTILTKDTVDDRVHDILYTKKSISKYIVDNELDLRNNPELFDLLLSDSMLK